MHHAPARRNSDRRRPLLCPGLARHGMARTGRAHTVGLILAGAILFVFAVVVLIFVVRTPAAATGSSTLPTSSSEPAPDIKSLPSGGQTGGVSNLNRGGQFFARVSAKDDPSRLIGEICGEKYEPLENQRIKLERPEGWAFLKSGRTVHISADSGMAYMPDQGNGARPRDAVLNGHVVIWVFDPLPGGKRPKLGTDLPFAIITTSVLTFDGELNQLKFPEEFVATSEAGSWMATDLTMLFNDVDQRLELLHVTKTKYLILNPGYQSPQPASAAVAAAPAPTTPPAPSSPVAHAATPGTSPAPAPHATTPVETLYHMICTDNVVVVQSGRQVKADKLDGWVRLEDNSLRPGAIAGMNSTSTKPKQKKQATKSTSPDATPQPTPAPSTNTPQPAIPQESTPAPSTSSPFLPIDDSAPITITWDGPMEVRPLSGSPGELAHNDVFARFTSEKDGGTNFTDEKTKAVATGALLEYGATRREVALASHEPMAATITYPGGGIGRAQRFEMSLASGLVQIPTRGIISAESTGTSSPIFAIGDTSPANAPADAAPVTRSLSWTDRAEFQLIKNAQQEVTSVLSEVHANGDAKATDGHGFLTGESLIAQFKPISPKASRLDRLQVAGQANGGDGNGSTLTSDTLDVAFIENPDKPEQSDPSVVTAQGRVHAHSVDKKNGDLNLSSSYLQTRLSRNVGGALEVTRLDARQSVAFDTADGVHAKAEDLNVDPITNTAHLTGPPMTVEVTKDGTTITGQDMTLWNVERKLDSKGKGTLVHDGPIEAPGQPKTEGQSPKSDPGHVEASWTRGMTFEDAGTAVCLGDVNAVVTKPPHTKPSGEPVGLERDMVSADEVHLTFTPPPAHEDTKADPALGPPAPKPERKLLTIHAIGTPGADDTKLAKVESRSYAAPPTGPAIDEPAVERILFLTGAEINLDNDRGTLDLPNPGKLLIVDTRAAATPDKSKPDKPDANPFPFDTSSGLRGKTLFTWKGSMSMDRPTGVIHMNDHVVVLQNNDKDNQTRLECEKLTAYIREQQPDIPKPDAPKPPSDSLTGELTAADAEGSVKLSSGTHEVTANTLHYDALKKIATLTAAPDNIVTITDNKARTQLTSREKIEWDLANDRISVSKPGTIVAPVDPKKSLTSPKK